MTITVAQNKELDSLKSNIETIENNLCNARGHLLIAMEFGDVEDQSKYETAIDFGHKQINKIVTVQAQAMKLEYNLLLDLIFDREHTLEKFN